MAKKITIDPITRLEGHGKIEIFLDEKGNATNAYLQVPELKGFEQFCVGRPVEELPRITPRICGVCPTTHHMAATKAVDAVYNVKPTETAVKVRRVIYDAFMMEDHLLHFFFLGGPDFVVGPDAAPGERNILGVVGKVGVEIGKKVIDIRRRMRSVITTLGGRVIHPVCGLPGGVSKGITEDQRKEFLQIARDSVDFAQFALKIFDDVVLKNKTYVDLIVGDIYKHETYYMGLVDENNHPDFYDGKLRVVDPDGKEIAKFAPKDYLDHIVERVEPWSYIKFPYLKNVGWKGFTDGKDSGVYRVAPLARLNVADGMATPLAQKEYEKMYKILGGKPAHHTLAFHWARLIEVLFAAEHMVQLLEDKTITSTDIRNIPTDTPKEGIGIVEAPRGTLIHHYKTDEQGMVTGVNLIVATVGNSAAMSMSIAKAAQSLIKNGEFNDGILNMIEMAFRPYDPCLACATHSLPGKMPLKVNIYDKDKNKVKTITRD
ncbi:MAG: Ni/Fe hydrogenase subunit alpha [Candidatus Cloacimonetes bacterium]|nr:Ni/Fe hydrogenase subunit alpha [Candidatus Cloacimonadota bacterium]MCF7813440.1 Ni/Fe hydrogenase subunit alpha [Candidatus Cloacimonadota bacterium]MCF7867733.1 Ni/Fe hydrogenase subunit alpha [Candidatus Cloacimonadota bacterium]MCF7883181.1 Ni/Fe hydrogenase subunit alpha [Candidatus Cloacimonadota bacterium]